MENNFNLGTLHCQSRLREPPENIGGIGKDDRMVAANTYQVKEGLTGQDRGRMA